MKNGEEEKNKNWIARHKILTGVVVIVLIMWFLYALGSKREERLQSGAQNEVGTASSAGEAQQPPSADKALEWQTVKTFSGKGDQDTESFTISGDRVKVTATTSGGRSSSGTYSSVSLESDSGGYLGTTGLSISTEKAGEEGHGETTYRNLTPGDYYVSVISGVNWEVTVEEYL